MAMAEQQNAAEALQQIFLHRFGETLQVPQGQTGTQALLGLGQHRSHRRYSARPVEPALLRLLSASALSAPSKSDLQQADILNVTEPALRDALAALLPSMPWVRKAPVFLVFLANGRRIRKIAAQRDKPFANDHLDAFFNAVVDTGIVLGQFLVAAEAAGLGCCPISVIRNHASEVSRLLRLPDLVIPVAGLCLGYPADEGEISPRLPLSLTLHQNRFDDGDLASEVATYDQRRERFQPIQNQRSTDRFGRADVYGWSEDKARQYAEPQRQDFGAFVRGKGFCLD